MLAGTAAAQPVFVDTAAAKHMVSPESSYGRSAAMADFDGDGLLDLLVLNHFAPRVVLHQLPDRTFEDISSTWGLAPTYLPDWCSLAADFDNDGDDDLFIAIGGFSGQYPNALLRNDLATTGQFTDVSAQAGDVTIVSSTFGATALDWDGDGLVDIFMCSTTPHGQSVIQGRGYLLHNEGGLVFHDVGPVVGVDGTADYRHASAGDVDNDGNLDIAAGAFDGNNRLWVHEPDGTFSDIARSNGIAPVPEAFGMVPADFDQDGWLDIYLPLYQFVTVTKPSQLFRNLGIRAFANVTAGSGMTGQTDMGHNVFDLDDDGYPEIYVGTGSPPTPYLDRYLAVFANGTGGFQVQDWSAASGVEAIGPTRTHGTVAGDIDGDGDIDLFLNRGTYTKNEPNVLLENQGTGHAWIEVELRGIASNRTGVGARVTAKLESGRVVSKSLLVGRGFGNTDWHVQHLGLGNESRVQRLVITWPSGIEQVLLTPASLARHVIVETGLRLSGAPTPGGAFTLQVVGPGGRVADILLSMTTGDLPLPKYGGKLLLSPPLYGPFDVTLPPQGLLNLHEVLPPDAALSGVTLYLQCWVHEPQATSGGTLTNGVKLTIQ